MPPVSKKTPPLNEGAATRLAQQLAADDLSSAEIVNELVERGVDRAVATFIVFQHSGAPQRARRKAGVMAMVTGAMIIVVGAAIPFLTEGRTDAAGSGRFVLAFGAVTVGLAQFLRGLVLSAKG